MTERYPDLTGWLISGALHILLALLCLVLLFELKPFELKHTTIAFVPLGGPMGSGGSGAREFTGEKPLIELPRRQTLDETSPLLRLPDNRRRIVEAPSPADKPDLTSGKKLIGKRSFKLDSPSPDVRDRPGFRAITIDDDELTGQHPDALSETLSGDEMFSISWEGPARKKISGKLPEFPEGVNMAAVVRISFEVTPDGSVSFAAPSTKGLPEFERVSIEALKTWRFNPLDKSETQIKQRGEVTFIYKLK